MSTSEFDFIVVGGGSAGSTMARRLVENQQKSVLLIEAGPESDVDEPHSPLRDASRLVLENYNWAYEAYLNVGNTGSGNAVIKTGTEQRKVFGYKTGKVLGGSSAINGAVALRPLPSDFKQWQSLGCDTWGWEDVLPWLNQLETDVDFEEQEIHGSHGPMRLRRPTDEELHPLDNCFSSMCQKHGVPYIDDLNTGEDEGVGLVPSNVGEFAERFDVYRSYLHQQDALKNLQVLTNVQVEKVTFVGNQANGVIVEQAGQQRHIKGREIVLCAGAIGSPAILQRSGIGDREILEPLGIDLIKHLPAVGANLQDHASVVLWSIPKSGVCESGKPWRQVAARMVSGYDQKLDVQIGLLNNVERSTVPRFKDLVDTPMLVGTSVMLMQPITRGQVAITSSDVNILPDIQYPIRDTEEDIARLVHGVRKAWKILQEAEIKEFIENVQFWSDSVINSDVVMFSAIKNLVNPGWHASGTIRMGQIGDPKCAVDQKGRVFGVEGLTIADASLFPVIPSMPTNLSTIMVAERIANILKQGSEYRDAS